MRFKITFLCLFLGVVHCLYCNEYELFEIEYNKTLNEIILSFKRWDVEDPNINFVPYIKEDSEIKSYPRKLIWIINCKNKNFVSKNKNGDYIIHINEINNDLLKLIRSDSNNSFDIKGRFESSQIKENHVWKFFGKTERQQVTLSIWSNKSRSPLTEIEGSSEIIEN